MYVIMNSTCPTVFDDNGPNVLSPIKVLLLHVQYCAACCQSPADRCVVEARLHLQQGCKLLSKEHDGLHHALLFKEHVVPTCSGIASQYCSPLHKGNMSAFWKESPGRSLRMGQSEGLP